MSHFARKVLGPNPPRYIRDETKEAFVETIREAVRPQLEAIPPRPQYEIRASLRLRIWVRGTPEEHREGRKGWLPVLLAGSSWDEEQARLQYKARGICTWFLKVGLEQNAT